MPRVVLIVLVTLFFGGCSCGSSVTVRTDSPESGPVSKPEARPKKDTPAKFHIPPGHLPKQGLCRIWIPGVPPGQQAPAAACSELVDDVPPGAWLIRGVAKKSKEFEVVVYDETPSHAVAEIRIYSTKDGSFLGLR